MEKVKKFNPMPGDEKAALAASWLDEKQGMDIRVLDVRGLCSITDHLVLVTAKGVRHAQALADHINDQAGKGKFEFLGMEGYQTGEWVLLDMNDVIIHIFMEENRRFYDIEGLWAEGKPIDFSKFKPSVMAGKPAPEAEADTDGDED